jgi:acyl-coenzyme A thioesterase 9
MLLKRLPFPGALPLLRRSLGVAALRASSTSTIAVDERKETLEKLRDSLTGVTPEETKRAQQVMTRRSHQSPQDAMEATVSSAKYKLYQAARREKRPMPLGNCPDLDHIVKRPQDSLLRILLPFSSDPAFAESYVNFRKTVRVGRLLEDLDAFAGAVAYLHCDDGKEDVEPPILVTVSTDQISLLTYPLEPNCDMMLVGMVSAVGASSMSIDIDLVALPNPALGIAEQKPILQAAFTFVARNSENKPVKVPQLKPVSEFEIKMNQEGLKGMEERKVARKASLYKQPPTVSELHQVHSLFLEAQAISHDRHGLVNTPKGTIGWIDDYRSTSTTLTMPQERNVHNRIFGGFLMRSAFELAFSHAWKTTGSLPKFLSLDATEFLYPVEIGQILTFDAVTVYSPGPSSKVYSVEVTAKMLNPNTSGGLTARANGKGAGTDKDGGVTNTFAFTFHSDEPDKTPRLLPRTYSDAMKFLEAQRRVTYGSKLADARKASGSLQSRFPVASNALPHAVGTGKAK